RAHGPAEDEGRESRWPVAHAEVAADDWHVVERGCLSHPLQRLARQLLRSDDGVDDREGPPTHRRDVVDVGEDGSHSGAMRMGRDEGRKDRFTGYQQAAL